MLLWLVHSAEAGRQVWVSPEAVFRKRLLGALVATCMVNLRGQVTTQASFPASGLATLGLSLQRCDMVASGLPEKTENSYLPGQFQICVVSFKDAHQATGNCEYQIRARLYTHLAHYQQIFRHPQTGSPIRLEKKCGSLTDTGGENATRKGISET